MVLVSDCWMQAQASWCYENVVVVVVVDMIFCVI